MHFNELGCDERSSVMLAGLGCDGLGCVGLVCDERGFDGLSYAMSMKCAKHVSRQLAP